MKAITEEFINLRLIANRRNGIEARGLNCEEISGLQTIIFVGFDIFNGESRQIFLGTTLDFASF
ncbi:MAG: hypothetical protein H7318_09485 [Oligoflexus sp.]|nr:hypothetical protein [Oligoflexus sp.]